MWRQTLTGQYGAPLALLLHVSMFLPWQSEWRLKHEALDVVVSLKICPFVLLLFLVKVGHHIRHLDVGKLGVQVFRIYLFLKQQWLILWGYTYTDNNTKQPVHLVLL